MTEVQKQDSLKNAWDALERNADLTRRIRFIMAGRLSRFENYIQGINIYYSCFTVLLSVLSLIYPDQTIGFISVGMTVILAISIVYLNGQKFGERSNRVRLNANAMTGLYLEIKRNGYGSAEELRKLEERYVELLNQVENHMNHDFLDVMMQQDRIHQREEHINHVRGWEKMEYYAYKALLAAVCILTCGLPVVLAVWVGFIIF